MSERPPPQGVILFANVFPNVNIAELLSGVVLDEADFNSVLSTAHNLETSQVDSVPVAYDLLSTAYRLEP